jgi:hypothetical protein
VEIVPLIDPLIEPLAYREHEQAMDERQEVDHVHDAHFHR